MPWVLARKSPPRSSCPGGTPGGCPHAWKYHQYIIKLNCQKIRFLDFKNLSILNNKITFEIKNLSQKDIFINTINKTNNEENIFSRIEKKLKYFLFTVLI